MSAIYLKRARDLEQGDVLLLAGPVYVRPARVLMTRAIPDEDPQIVELAFFDEEGVLGFPLDTVMTTIDPLEPWPA